MWEQNVKSAINRQNSTECFNDWKNCQPKNVTWLVLFQKHFKTQRQFIGSELGVGFESML